MLKISEFFDSVTLYNINLKELITVFFCRSFEQNVGNIKKAESTYEKVRG